MFWLGFLAGVGVGGVAVALVVAAVLQMTHDDAGPRF